MLQTLLAISTLAILAGCAAGPSRPVAARILPVQGRQLALSAIRAEDRGTAVRVRGRVARRALTRGAIWGHLHIEAWGARGLLRCRDTFWSHLSPRRSPAAFFSTTIPVRPTDVQEIRISHLTTAHQPCSSGTHS